MLVWLLHGPDRRRIGTRVVAGFWLLTTLVGVPWILSFFQESIWLVSRPGVLAWFGAVDIVGIVLVYGWVIYLGRDRLRAQMLSLRATTRRSDAPDRHPSA
jgi:alpha-1,2-mannosyltransferase